MPNEVKLLPSNSAKFCCVRRMGDYVIIAVTPKGEEPSRYWLSRGGAETLCAEISGALSRPTTVVTDEVVEPEERPKFVELFGHLDHAQGRLVTPLSEGPQLSKAAAERLRKMEQLDLQALLSACKFPVGATVTYHDEEGAHDPCYVVLPGGAMLPLNHWGDELTDVARAVFIVRACNAALASTPTVVIGEQPDI